MNLRLLSIFFIFTLCTKGLLSQTTLSFQPIFNKLPLQLDSYYHQLNDSIQIETFKFYISEIEFLKNGKPVWKEEKSFHLIDASKINSSSVLLKTPSGIVYTEIKFNLGIDSTTNVSGALGGDLDPTKGMYWTWQSGYINLKLEGKSNLCQTRNNAFEFHFGGYQYPNSACQKISLKTIPKEKIIVSIDIQKFISRIDLTKENQIMSPSATSKALSELMSNYFTIK